MKLSIEQGELVGQEFALARPVITLGRGTESDIVLLVHGVSRQHARLQQTPQGWKLTDLGSTNGTLINGRRIQAHEAHLLHVGDRITIGNSVLVVQEEEAPGMGAASAQEGMLSGRKPNPALVIGGALLLVVVLVGIVALLVVVLQPEEEKITTPTPGNPAEQIMTVLPVPTQFQEVVPSVVPLIPTGLPIPFGPLGATATPPPPGAALPEPPTRALQAVALHHVTNLPPMARQQERSFERGGIGQGDIERGDIGRGDIGRGDPAPTGR